MELETAIIHTTGRLAGKIDVPIRLGNTPEKNWGEFQLQIDDGPPIVPGCMDRFGDLLVLYYFSRQIGETGELPHRLQWIWPGGKGKRTFRRTELKFESHQPVGKLRPELIRTS